MKRFRFLLPAALALSLISVGSRAAHAQQPQNWKSFEQTFALPQFPQVFWKYAHSITVGKEQLRLQAVREFSSGEHFTGIVTMNLADIDPAKMQIVKGNQSYQPQVWYLYVSVKNPKRAPERVLATPQTDRDHLIVKEEVRLFNGQRRQETWILTRMYINFDNEAAAQQALADITAACPK